MFFSRALLIVYKTTGGRAWNPPGGLKPLSLCQQRNRRRNTELTLKNLSVIKMAAASQPEQPTRLYKPLPHWRLLWMRRRMEQSKEVLGWSAASGGMRALQARVRALSARLHAPPAEAGAAQAKLP